MSNKNKLPYLPYTYLIEWSAEQTGLGYAVRYYGCKYGVGAHPELFWVNYFTSSEKVTEKRMEWGEPTRTIRKTFPGLSRCKKTSDFIQEYEKRVLMYVNAMSRSDYLNKSNGSNRFMSTNNGRKAAVVKATGKKIKVKSDDTRIATGEIEIDSSWYRTARGLKYAIVKATGKKIKVKPDDPRIATGEIELGWDYWSSLMRATEVYTGKMIKVVSDDPRIMSGDVILGWNIRPSAGTRWATDTNTGERLQVYPDDPRFITGEIIPGFTQKECYNLRTYNNGIEQKRFRPGTEPNGWSQGRIKSGVKYYNNGKEQRKFVPGTEPEGWKQGSITVKNAGKSHYNNGTESRLFYPDKVPDGWIPGRIARKRMSKKINK